MSFLKNIPGLRSVLVFGYRTVIGLRHLGHQISLVTRWLFRSKETTNFTYELTPDNLRYLTAFVSEHTGKPFVEIDRYIQEISNDQALKEHIIRITKASGEAHKADQTIYFCKRLGWYAFIRALRPRVVIETGVDKGLGSCVIAAALLRNEAEGTPGHYYGTDINPLAGYLLQAPYDRVGQILYGDSIASLEAFQQPVDLFINDSDHSADYEAREYAVIHPKLAPGAYILGDNCHATPKLLEFALRTGKRFAFFREEPRDHWYAGAGIGVAYDQ